MLQLQSPIQKDNTKCAPEVFYVYGYIYIWWEDRKLMRLRRTKMGWHTLDIALGRKSDRCTCFASSTIIARAETGLFYKKVILSFPLVLTWLLAIWIYVFLSTWASYCAHCPVVSASPAGGPSCWERREESQVTHRVTMTGAQKQHCF